MLARKAQVEHCKLEVCLQQSLQEECSKFSSHLHVHCRGRRVIAMESGAVNNFYVIVKQITKFDGWRADEFLEWDSKLRASLSMHNKTIFNALQEQQRPPEFDVNQKTTRATWDAANQDLYSVLFLPTAGSAFSVVRRFQGKTPTERSRTRRTGVGSPSQEILRVFAGSHSGGARQDEKHADAPRSRPQWFFVPHG